MHGWGFQWRNSCEHCGAQPFNTLLLLRHGPADARSRAGVARCLHGVIMHCDAHPIPAMRPSETPAWRDPLGLMLASTGEGVFGVALAGLFVFLNPSGPSMIGLQPDPVLGQHIEFLTLHANAVRPSSP